MSHTPSSSIFFGSQLAAGGLLFSGAHSLEMCVAYFTRLELRPSDGRTRSSRIFARVHLFVYSINLVIHRRKYNYWSTDYSSTMYSRIFLWCFQQEARGAVCTLHCTENHPLVRIHYSTTEASWHCLKSTGVLQ